MNRPMKFRAWNKEKDLMEKAFDLIPSHDISGKTYYPLVWTRNENGEWPDTHILMQFTGLKDRHGVDIYEGDIVRYNHPTSSPSGVDHSPAHWTPSTLAIKFVGQGFNVPDKLFEPEVIGNIWEHPELLKEKL